MNYQQTTQNNNDLTFSLKAQQVICSTHKRQIIQLEVGPDTLVGDRLLCDKCSPYKKLVLNLSEVDTQMKQWKSDEQKQIDGIKTNLHTAMESFELAIKEVNQMIEAFLNYVKYNLTPQVDYLKKMQEQCLKNFQAQLQKKQDTKFQQIYQQYSNNPLTQENLQNVAVFIAENGQNNLEQTVDNPFRNYDKYLLQFKELYKQLTIVKQDKSTYLTGNVMDIHAIAISKDDQFLASADKSGLIILWQIATKQQIQRFENQGEVRNLIFSPDSKKLVATQLKSPYKIFIFDLREPTNNLPKIIVDGYTTLSQNIDNSIRRIQFTYDSKYLLSTISEDKAIMIWDLDNNQFTNLVKFSKSVYGMSVSNDQKYISVCCESGIAYLFDSQSVTQMNQLLKWQAHNENAYGTTFTQDSKIILTSNTEIKLWSIDQLLSNNQIPLKTFQGTKTMWNLDILSNGLDLVAYDGEIKIWNLNSNMLVINLKVPDLKDYEENKKYAITSNRKCLFLALDSKVQIQEFMD